MRKRNRNYSEDNTWQAVYMDLLTLIMILFLILWSIQSGGEGAPVDTNNIIPFYKVTLKDSSFPDGGVVFKGAEKDKLVKYLTTDVKDDFVKLGHDAKKKNYYYITVHGHGSLTGNFEQNMNIALQRASSVANAIKEAHQKVPKSEFKNPYDGKQDKYMVSVCGHSYNFPKVDLDSTLSGEMRSKQQEPNRRVDVMYHKVPDQVMEKYFLNE